MTKWQWNVIMALVRIVLKLVNYPELEASQSDIEILEEAENRYQTTEYKSDEQ